MKSMLGGTSLGSICSQEGVRFFHPCLFSHNRRSIDSTELSISITQVRQLDWVDNVWPKELIRQQRDSTNNMDDMKYPKVRKYVG